MSKKKKIYSPDFKAKVVLELLSGQHSLNELAQIHQIAPATLSSWHRQFQERAAQIFQSGPSDQEEALAQKEEEIAVLQQKVGQLSIECDWLKKKNLTKSLDHKERTELVTPENETLTIKRQCELLDVNRISVYRTKEERIDHGEPEENLTLMTIIDKIHLEHPAWGYRKIAHYLRNSGHDINRKRVRRLMRLMDIQALYPGPNLSRRYHAQYVRPYLLRNLVIERIDQVWGIDITYVPLKKGFLYLFVIIDWFSRRIVDYEISYSLEKEFVLRCLRRALCERKPEIMNSDQGSHFTCPAYLKLLDSCDVKVSMDGKGQALDNVRTERFFRSLKYDDLYIKEYETPKEMITEIRKYIHTYNTIRPHASLGGLTPYAFCQNQSTHHAA
ncbi:IS3 family transposase [Proteiniclasticum sp. QWL-01]|uniref:IS3 family transposase n=1 Tax=Proteiniclasticum sp. QWL-01 TaxID=3036945 RepID=UPI00241104BF|nr:IS3 family transposase [Proteiniclasticum sp. QWL-01]WFF73685.1 IS3 family transposase [Proteiniclasticum sp. QWL-01]